jgi:hypothetical protein
MEPDAKKKTRIAALGKKMDDIHLLNSAYWERGEAVTSEAKAEYERRVDRVEEIRRELVQLRST